MIQHLHRFIAEVNSRLGPNNPFLQFRLKRWVREKGGLTARFTGHAVELGRSGRTIKLPTRQWMFARDLASDFDSPFDTLFDDNGLLDFSVPAWHTYRKSGLSFFLTGLPEEEEALGSYFSLCRPSHGDLVFDIGANCGVTTHVLSLLVGAAGRVIAFEPDPDSFHALLANIDRHSLRNVVPIHKAIAAASGIERFNAEGSLGSGLSAFVPRPSAGRVLSVQCSSLADAFAQYGEPTFVKMDVEGAEIAILNAARIRAGYGSHGRKR